MTSQTTRQPAVSAVIANHDYADFVVEAVESALAQTYPCAEVIVVDDASTDDSVERLRARFGDRIRLLALVENRRQVRALEHGIAAANGDVVCLLDADDRWLPDKVERVVEAFGAHPDAVQVSHALRSIDAQGRPIGSGRRRLGRRFVRRMPLNVGDVRRQLFRWNRYGFAITSGLSYPRSVLEEMGPMPERFESRSTYFDTWSTIAAAFIGPVAAIDEPLMEYRIHDANAAGGSTDFERFAACWRMTGELVDHWAERTGDPRRSHVDARDNRLAVFRHLSGESVPRRRLASAIASTPRESIDIGAGALEAIVQTLERLVMCVSRRHGAAVKRRGLYRWIRSAVSRER